MDKAILKQHALACGWTEDAYGHMKSPSGRLRIKMQSISVRVERKFDIPATLYSRASSDWTLMVSDYLKNIEFKANREGVQCMLVGGKLVNLRKAAGCGQ